MLSHSVTITFEGLLSFAAVVKIMMQCFYVTTGVTGAVPLSLLHGLFDFQVQWILFELLVRFYTGLESISETTGSIGVCVKTMIQQHTV